MAESNGLFNNMKLIMHEPHDGSRPKLSLSGKSFVSSRFLQRLDRFEHIVHMPRHLQAAPFFL